MKGAERPPRVAVIGSGDATPEEAALAEKLGAALAGAGCVVVSGGKGGVMEAASRGAHGAGGLTVGILPDGRASAANPWVAVPIATGMGEARNALVVGAAEAVVAVGGAWGTLSEIAFALRAGLAVAVLGTPPVAGLPLRPFTDPGEAAAWAHGQALRRRSEDSGR